MSKSNQTPTAQSPRGEWMMNFDAHQDVHAISRSHETCTIDTVMYPKPKGRRGWNTSNFMDIYEEEKEIEKQTKHTTTTSWTRYWKSRNSVMNLLLQITPLRRHMNRGEDREMVVVRTMPKCKDRTEPKDLVANRWPMEARALYARSTILEASSCAHGWRKEGRKEVSWPCPWPIWFAEQQEDVQKVVFLQAQGAILMIWRPCNCLFLCFLIFLIFFWYQVKHPPPWMHLWTGNCLAHQRTFPFRPT